MKKTYMIDVDCANCAAKMEQAANTVEGILSASVNYTSFHPKSTPNPPFIRF